MDPLRVIWIVIFLTVLVWSGIGPHDYPTWWLEVSPALIGAGILWATRNRFPLTRMTYILILIHCIILMIGGHYTYAEVPLGEWISEAFDQTRNNYDKLGHFAQGFIPAIIARELGIPCVNGIEDLLGRLKDGDPLTVDGHLGLVTVGPPDFALEGVTLP